MNLEEKKKMWEKREDYDDEDEDEDDDYWKSE